MPPRSALEEGLAALREQLVFKQRQIRQLLQEEADLEERIEEAEAALSAPRA